MNGELKKMEIRSYPDVKLLENEIKGLFTALINPENYSQTYQVKLNEEQTTGTTASPLRFISIEPRTMEFEFIFDQTGAIAGTKKTNNGVEDDIVKFKELTLGYDGKIHRTRYLRLSWGSLNFKCCIETLVISYKLFRHDGKPLRATAKCTFKEFMDDELQIAKKNNSSPDLTHLREVKTDANLPYMAYSIYGDSKYYMQAAAANNLTSVRQLQEGSRIAFPPIDKNSN